MSKLENDKTAHQRLNKSELLGDDVWITLDRRRLVHVLDRCLAEDELEVIRHHIGTLRDAMIGPLLQAELLADVADEEISFRKDVLLADLDQILEAHTLQRTKYYITRLRKGATEVRTGRINDINLNRWKEYDDIVTDSLWVMERRDSSGSHKAWYWGNFIPQIPHQMLRRYTRPGDWVLDTFVGSGTTLIECRRLGRNGLGIELNPEVAARARAIVAQEPNPHAVTTEIVQGDSTTLDYESLLRERELDSVQLLLMHPPYHDIIQFSDDAQDLSNAPSLDAFVAMFSEAVARACAVLERGRYLAIVIGDKYVKGEWIPLGFHVMQATMARGYTLKSIVVKNFDETRAKREQKALWRYRALVGGFYVFKHEYVLIFTKS